MRSSPGCQPHPPALMTLAHTQGRSSCACQPPEAGELYSVIALDLDGTLLTDDLRITGRTRTAIRRARERGVTVFLASARPPRAMRWYHRELELDTPGVAYNGALVWDLTLGEPLFHE